MNEQEIQSEVPALLEREATIVVKDSETYTTAATEMKGGKAMIKKIKDFFKPLKSKANEAHKAITQKERETLAPVEEFCKKIQGKMIAFQSEQDRIRREEEARIREEQRKREEEAKIAEAAEAEAAGDVELAEQIIMEPVAVAPVVVPKKTPDVQGVSYRETWKAEVVDALALVKFVADNPTWAHLITVNTRELNNLARSQKTAMKIPGVRAYAEKSIATRI